jgi:hypothetical protein
MLGAALQLHVRIELMLLVRMLANELASKFVAGLRFSCQVKGDISLHAYE